MSKHKFKRERRWVYLVISRCEYCGLQRQKIGDKTYLYDPFGLKLLNEPQCSHEENLKVIKNGEHSEAE